MINVRTINEYLSAHGKPLNEGYLLKDKGRGNEIERWSVDGLKEPSVRELKKIHKSLIQSDEAIAYRLKRKRAYPDVGDQLDAIWKQLKKMDKKKLIQLDDETKEMLQAVLKVKETYPKD